jgi:hypothetical protein
LSLGALRQKADRHAFNVSKASPLGSFFCTLKLTRSMNQGGGEGRQKTENIRSQLLDESYLENSSDADGCSDPNTALLDPRLLTAVFYFLFF